MLVLTRKTQQRIQIGSQITITILQVKGQAVRVGIEAPRDVSVLRSELASKMAAEVEAEADEEPARPVKCKVRIALPGAMNPGEEKKMVGNPANQNMRSRLPGAKVSPLSHHLERSGAASLLSSSVPPMETSLQAILTR